MMAMALKRESERGCCALIDDDDGSKRVQHTEIKGGSQAKQSKAKQSKQNKTNKTTHFGAAAAAAAAAAAISNFFGDYNRRRKEANCEEERWKGKRIARCGR